MIYNVNDENLKDVTNFLNKVATIADVDIDIVKNAMIVKEEDEIIGILSFEKFGKFALIRYFVFKRAIKEDVVLDLINEVASKARVQGVSSFLTLVVKDDLIELFKGLGFTEINKQDIFIDEDILADSKYGNSTVLKLELL